MVRRYRYIFGEPKYHNNIAVCTTTYTPTNTYFYTVIWIYLFIYSHIQVICWFRFCIRFYKQTHSTAYGLHVSVISVSTVHPSVRNLFISTSFWFNSQMLFVCPFTHIATNVYCVCNCVHVCVCPINQYMTFNT